MLHKHQFAFYINQWLRIKFGSCTVVFIKKDFEKHRVTNSLLPVLLFWLSFMCDTWWYTPVLHVVNHQHLLVDVSCKWSASQVLCMGSKRCNSLGMRWELQGGSSVTCQPQSHNQFHVQLAIWDPVLSSCLAMCHVYVRIGMEFLASENLLLIFWNVSV